MDENRKALLIVALFYFFLMFIILMFFNFNFSSRIYLTEKLMESYNHPIPHNLVLYTSNRGYDGNYYYKITADIILKHIDISSIRYQRIMYPLVVKIFSLNKIDLIPFSMIAVNFFAIILSAFFL